MIQNTTDPGTGAFSCGELGPAQTGCNKPPAHQGMHHEPKTNPPGGHWWFGTYKKIVNRPSVF